ncbi:MerR family transcriptional regulator [Enterococcus sp. BWR-S5]|uniref:MerR family transcriptional regulator n=1 Tax=Enterococcus sp. BWR-S5 TaxID=2787714 RepID=UPI001921E9AE|nr:MerR family transcriptional regulator [Enterococcus sp. BWR-S5]MBL1227509.1 MerR family transcriptional regulator [Enterococcus sp. BWR-S5]
MITIKEVSEKFGITTHTIRFYEKEKLVAIPRNERGIRDFDERSITRVKTILHYRNVGMSLEDIRRVLAHSNDHNFSLSVLAKTKEELDRKIMELEETRSYLDRKIAIHQELAEKENAKKLKQLEHSLSYKVN